MARKKSAPKTPPPSEPRAVIVQEKRRVFDGFFKIDRALVSYRDEFGAAEAVPIEVFERGDSVGAMLHDPVRGVVILTEQFRYPTYEKGPGWMIEIVAGSIEEGETAEDCIRREMREEIGYEIDALEFISRFYVSPGGASERIFLFYCAVNETHLKDPAARGLAHQNERVSRIEMPEEEFFSAIETGVVQDAKSIVAGLWLRRKLGR